MTIIIGYRALINLSDNHITIRIYIDNNIVNNYY